MGFLSMLGDLIGGAMKAMEEHAKEMGLKNSLMGSIFPMKWTITTLMVRDPE